VEEQVHSVGHEQLPGQRRGQPGQPARGARGVRRGESRPGAGRHALSIGRHQTAVTVRSDAAARRALRPLVQRDGKLGAHCAQTTRCLAQTSSYAASCRFPKTAKVSLIFGTTHSLYGATKDESFL
jgi:hypothetical protein